MGYGPGMGVWAVGGGTWSSAQVPPIALLCCQDVSAPWLGQVEWVPSTCPRGTPVVGWESLGGWWGEVGSASGVAAEGLGARVGVVS